jgi:hypothetical protein
MGELTHFSHIYLRGTILIFCTSFSIDVKGGEISGKKFEEIFKRQMRDIGEIFVGGMSKGGREKRF